MENNDVYIPQIDGKDLWITNFMDGGSGYTTYDKNGKINTKRYKATLDYSLDLIKLREVYYKTYRNSRFSQFVSSGGEPKEYCDRVINVTFKYSVKEFNRNGKDIYIKYGYRADEIEWRDCVGYGKSGEFAGIRVNAPVESPVSDLDKYIEIGIITDKDGNTRNAYKIKPNIKCLHSVDEIRTRLYNDGFYCNGIHYIRWKRSAGSARLGKCLFIDEKMYNRIHYWEMCGLKVSKGDKVDLAALQSYISLVSSSIIGLVTIKPENILVIEPYTSRFTDDVVNVFDEDGKLQAREERMEIENNIWDGQSLIDPSLMGEYSDKGMILLRSRFFKSCAFNCNVQQWFENNGITDVSQLNGFTLASDIHDVKLITTKDSIKYVKFGTLEQWFENLEPEFGVVKYEKPPHYMDGKLAQTHYQLLNSIQMTRDEMKKFLKPTFDFMTLLKTNPAVLRWWIKYRVEDEVEPVSVRTKTDVIYKMMSVNTDFYRTKFYDDFKRDFMKSFTKNLKCGHVYVNGNYSTLCGNPIEMLQQSIGKFEGKRAVERDAVYCKRFAWDKPLLGSRSPHITASNVLLTVNKWNELIDRYMNPTNEIVYVNSIEENIMQRLAGCDFDSDTVLLTDNEILIKAARRTTDMFKVAVYNVSGAKKPRRWNESDMADLDIKTSKNLIGEID